MRRIDIVNQTTTLTLARAPNNRIHVLLAYIDYVVSEKKLVAASLMQLSI